MKKENKHSTQKATIDSEINGIIEQSYEYSLSSNTFQTTIKGAN